MLQKLNSSSTTFLPLVPFLIKTVQFRFEVENNFFVFFSGGNSDLFESNDRSDLSAGVFVLDGGNIFLFVVIGAC
jgi:hypothetical protein